jgi:hypothetical protein
MCGRMPRALTLAVLVLALAAVRAAAQDPSAQRAPALAFAHDASLDGTAHEIHSGLYPGDPDGVTDPLAARYPDTYETFALDVPAGTHHASLTAKIAWTDARVDLDLSVYRAGPDGRPSGAAIARSATTGHASEEAVYAPQDQPVEAGTYVVVVDNVCSRDADDDPRSRNPAVKANCGIGAEVPDEDDFHGEVDLSNEPPTVTLAGPNRVPAKQQATFRAEAQDPEGGVLVYEFDLDGDGIYELDSDGNQAVQTSFPARGTRTIGVRVTDDAGATAFATKTVTVTRPPPIPDPRPPVSAFWLNRTSFGGAAGNWLIVSYRLRQRAHVKVTLYRDGRRLRLIDAGVRARRHTYRIVLKPAHLRRGLYTVRIAVLGASGKRQQRQLSARRR